VGDIFDIWKSDVTSDCFSSLFEGFEQIVYVLGNHDCLFKNLMFLTPQIKEKDILTFSGNKFLICHGHYFDSDFGKTSLFNTFADKFLYQFSKLINVDIRSKLHFFTEWYYNRHFFEKEKIIREKQIPDNFQYLITGHTHCPGEKEIDNLKLFNLGSWINNPHAFFLKGEQYAFIPITKEKLLPEKEDFKNLRGYRET
jgi:UDP-2,3-diacylglucosamine pyrophosphatase LpxH